MDAPLEKMDGRVPARPSGKTYRPYVRVFL